MDDSSIFGRAFDSLIELIVAMLFCTVGLINLQYQIRQMSDATDAYLNHDKVVITEADTADPFVMNAYQVYMLGYTIDNYGPTDKSGVLFADSSAGGATVSISPDTFHHSCTVRNRMISGKDSNSVASIIKQGVVTSLSEHYRGLDGTSYRLELCDDYSEGEGYLWTVQKQ